MIVKKTKKVRLTFTTNVIKALENFEVLLISADMSRSKNDRVAIKYVFAVAENCAKHIKNFILGEIKSMVSLETLKKITTSNYKLQILKTVNKYQKLILFDKINVSFNENFKYKIGSIWKISLKFQINAINKAISLHIINSLLQAKSVLKAYGFGAIRKAKYHFDNTITDYKNQYKSLINSNFVVILMEWLKFKFLSFKIIKKRLEALVIFNSKNIYNKEQIKRNSFEYFCTDSKMVENKKSLAIN